MAGLVPATHELRIGRIRRVWVAGTGPAMTAGKGISFDTTAPIRYAPPHAVRYD